MNPILRTPSRFLAVAAAALAMAFGAAYAAGGDMPGGPGAAQHAHGGGFMMMKQLDALHAQLKLTPDQEKQWQSALDTMKRNHEAEHANHEEMHKQFEALRQPSILDLNALDAAHRQFERQNAQLRDATMAAWLNVYNNLNDQQKTVVSDMLKQHFAKMAERHEKMREHWQKSRGAGADAMPESH